MNCLRNGGVNGRDNQPRCGICQRGVEPLERFEWDAPPFHQVDGFNHGDRGDKNILTLTDCGLNGIPGCRRQFLGV